MGRPKTVARHNRTSFPATQLAPLLPPSGEGMAGEGFFSKRPFAETIFTNRPLRKLFLKFFSENGSAARRGPSTEPLPCQHRSGTSCLRGRRLGAWAFNAEPQTLAMPTLAYFNCNRAPIFLLPPILLNPRALCSLPLRR